MMDFDNIRGALGSDIPQDSVFDKYVLKEYILLQVLDFLSRSEYIQKLAFIGGTALRLGYGINRFSEDLDFDCKNFSQDEFTEMTDQVVTYLSRIGYDVDTRDRANPNLKAYRRNIIFPSLLYNMGLSPHKEQTFLLKIESEDQGVHYESELLPIARGGYLLKIPSPRIETLCAMKVSAFLGRSKGRDIFDLMYLLGRTQPDLSFLEQKNGIQDENELWQAINARLQDIDLEKKSMDFRHLLFDESDAERIFTFSDFVKLKIDELSRRAPQRMTIKISPKEGKRKGRGL